MRLQKLTGGAGQRDQQHLTAVVPRWQRGIERMKQHHARHSPRIPADEYRHTHHAQQQPGGSASTDALPQPHRADQDAEEWNRGPNHSRERRRDVQLSLRDQRERDSAVRCAEHQDAF